MNFNFEATAEYAIKTDKNDLLHHFRERFLYRIIQFTPMEIRWEFSRLKQRNLFCYLNYFFRNLVTTFVL